MGNHTIGGLDDRLGHTVESGLNALGHHLAAASQSARAGVVGHLPLPCPVGRLSDVRRPLIGVPAFPGLDHTPNLFSRFFELAGCRNRDGVIEAYGFRWVGIEDRELRASRTGWLAAFASHRCGERSTDEVDASAWTAHRGSLRRSAGLSGDG